MEHISFDNGTREFSVGAGVLRFNPSDPNVYARFMEASEKIQAVEEELVKKAQQLQTESEGESTGETVLQLLVEADREAKKILAWIFGSENDFNQILGGANLLAVANNGERIITNFIYALMPIIEEGAKRCAAEQRGAAVAQAKMNRAKRRGQK